MNVPGYELEGEVARSRSWVLRRARRRGDGSPVLVKAALGHADVEAVSDRLEWEYRITRGLEIDGVLPAVALVPLDDGSALVLQDRGGVPLDAALGDGPQDGEAGVALGMKMAFILSSVHRAGVVHKALHPRHVLVHPETREVHLTGFEIASRLPDEQHWSGQLELTAGNLAYMAPEQTGRVNRRVGRQADLYSLGVLLYELLTGRVPFEADDPVELIHAHLAREPAPPHELQPGVSHALSRIVMKLLAKAAENRYRSALGVHADLEDCLDGSAARSGWAPGRRDLSDRLTIPETLYGRDLELDRLLSTFDRVASGATELLLVSGYSGIGKSALVNEIRRPIVRRRGCFISGKFDQFQRNIPHSAVISAFQELIELLLTGSEDQIASWRSRILEALQDNGQVITSVIPEVELIIGPQPPVPELPPAETKNRFNLVFERFIKVLARADHPLTLFLDDLQWADTATLALLQVLATDRSFRHLLILGAYRDNEVSRHHPLAHVLTELKAAKAPVGEIRLAPLSLEHVRRFVADTLRSPDDDAHAFAELVHEKTGGNPFFVIQFIKVLEREGRIAFDHGRGAWTYDLAAIREMGITDNVVDLMVRKIGQLPERTREAVKLAACIGNRFDLATLAIVRQVPARQTAIDLVEGIREGLILTESEASVRLAEFAASSRVSNPESAAYRFLHDRVQQAAYALIPDDGKQVVHLEVGRLRWRHSDDATLDEHLFEIAGHLNIGASLIETQEERTRLAELNLRAGLKAKAATAYKPALAYFEEGVGLLPRDPWSTRYELAFSLRRELAEAAYLCGHFERAERDLDRLLERARSPLDKAEIYRMRIVQCENTSRFVEARNWGVTGLALFEIHFPEGESDRRRMLDEEVRAIDELLGERDIAELADLPTMTDPAVRISMKLLMTMWAPSYISGDMMLTRLIAAKMVHLSLRYGNVEESAYGYVTYAARIGLRREDYAASYAFGRLALAVNERFDDLTARAKVNHMFSCYIGFWREPIASCFPYSREAHRAGLSSGDFIYSAYGVYHESWHALFGGQPLAEYHEHYSPYLEFMQRTRNQTFYDAHRQVLQLGLALQGRTESPSSLSAPGFDEAAFVEAYADLGFFLSIYYVTKLQLLYLLGRHTEAARMADAAERLADKTEGMIWDAWRCFYRALNLAALYPELDPEAGEEASSELDRLCAKLHTWAVNSPANFAHRHELVAAEIAALRGDLAAAIRAYQRAIELAAAAGTTQVEAVANERYARFWLELDNPDVAALYLRAASRAYDRWGATVKVDELRRRFPRQLPATPDGARASDPLDALDVSTVVRAAQVISGEVEQHRLLERLVRIVIEVAGAQRGCLLLEREGKLLVEAEAIAADRSGKVAQGAPIEPDRLAASIVHYVARVGESVVLADATRDDRFSNDPYIRERSTLSLLCTPILHQGKPIGMLYLENSLLRDAFTPERIEVVGILAAQAAISLENARLYGEMKQEISERRQAEAALQQAHAELELRVEARTEELSRTNLRLQEEIAERTQVEVRLQEAKEVAEAASRAKSEFLASMSHELRTPLNAILGYAQILQRDPQLAERHGGAVGVIEQSGEHLLTLIEDILSLSKIEAGKLEASTTDFRLTPFLEGVVDIARLRAEQKGLTFRYQPAPTLPEALRCDERWLRQVLLNLLGNAAKFTDRGGVVFRVDYLGEAEPPRLRFEVEDTGIGIPASRIEEIYEPFRQVHDPARREEGTGLGLAISKRLVRLMEGSLHARSRVGAGSLFTVELPIAEPALARTGTENRPISGYAGPPRKILVVDDRAENRSVLTALLTPLGFDLAEASDGREAVDTALAWRPDLVLMDLVMPVLDGFEATRRIRRAPELADVTVVALSASVFEHNRSQSLAAGCQDFVPKPVRVPDLLECLKTHLGIEWTYDPAPWPGALAPSGETADAAGRPPPLPPARRTLESLREAASVGDVQALQALLDEVENDGDDLGAFVAEMRRLASEYDMLRITEFLSPYLDAASEHEPV